MRRLCRNRAKSRLKGGFYFAGESRLISASASEGCHPIIVTVMQRIRPEIANNGDKPIDEFVKCDNIRLIEFHNF